MLTTLMTIFVTAFVLVALLGHAMVVRALLTPDPSA